MRAADECQNPDCDVPDVTVIDSRSGHRGRRRRRACNACGTRWTTVEILANGDRAVPGNRFAVEQALRGIAAATAALNILMEDLSPMHDDLPQQLDTDAVDGAETA